MALCKAQQMQLRRGWQYGTCCSGESTMLAEPICTEKVKLPVTQSTAEIAPPQCGHKEQNQSRLPVLEAFVLDYVWHIAEAVHVLAKCNNLLLRFALILSNSLYTKSRCSDSAMPMPLATAAAVPKLRLLLLKLRWHDVCVRDHAQTAGSHSQVSKVNCINTHVDARSRKFKLRENPIDFANSLQLRVQSTIHRLLVLHEALAATSLRTFMSQSQDLTMLSDLPLRQLSRPRGNERLAYQRTMGNNQDCGAVTTTFADAQLCYNIFNALYCAITYCIDGAMAILEDEEEDDGR
eukprot:11830-Heterococcus_DN1.PRE.4